MSSVGYWKNIRFRLLRRNSNIFPRDHHHPSWYFPILFFRQRVIHQYYYYYMKFWQEWNLDSRILQFYNSVKVVKMTFQVCYFNQLKFFYAIWCLNMICKLYSSPIYLDISVKIFTQNIGYFLFE